MDLPYYAISLNAVAFSIILVAGFFLNKPKGYDRINSHSSQEIEIRLTKLYYFQVIFAVIQIVLNGYLTFRLFGNEINENIASVLLPSSWVILALHFHRLNCQGTNVNGHMSAFMFLLLNCGCVTLQYYNSFDELGRCTQIIIITILALDVVNLIVLGLFNTRLADDDEQKISKEKGASLFSLFLFSWLTPLVIDGYKRPIEQANIWLLTEEDECKTVLDEYAELKGDKLMHKIFRMNAHYILYQYGCALSNIILTFSAPFYLYQIVAYIDSNQPRLGLLPYVFGLFGCSLFKAVTDGQMNFYSRRVGLRARIVMTDEIYKKCLHRIQSSDAESASLGNIVTLMSVDLERIREFFGMSHNLMFILPSSLIIAIVSLFFVLGWSAIVGILLIAILTPATSHLGKRILKHQTALLKNTDARVSKINEMLQGDQFITLGIRIVKYFAWEPYFEDMVTKSREKELNSYVQLWSYQIGFSTIGSASGILVIFSTFAMYTLVAGNTLNAATAFTAINLFKVVNEFLVELPSESMNWFKAWVSMKRVWKYLKEEELPQFIQEPIFQDHFDYTGFKDADFVYYGDQSPDQFKLYNLDVQFPSGQLTLVAGPTGSGKTSMLQALLGELKLVSGSFNLKNNVKAPVAYVAQTAWLLNASIRDNILFGEPYDFERYMKVVYACALAQDFRILPGGDLTEIGEKGINLSGGQKQRISLARACYSRASIVLLDDPLSAVDAPTAKILLKKAILEQLSGRTVILVSHAVNLVAHYADYIVLMKNGTIDFKGTALEAYDTNTLSDQDLSPAEGDEVDIGSLDALPSVIQQEDSGTQLIEKEKKAVGSVEWNTYYLYFKGSGGYTFIALFVFSFFLASSSKVLNDWWLKVWTDHNSAVSKDPIPPANDDSQYYIIIYAFCGVAVVIAKNIQTISVLAGSLWASRYLHTELLHSILYSPLRFFDVTPIGRVLNRFSKDIESVDADVMDYMRIFMEKIVLSLTTIIVIASIIPEFLLLTPFVLWIYQYIAKYYLASARELKRLNSVTRSPIYSHFAETLAGVVTIRSYDMISRFCDINLTHIDENQKPGFFMRALVRWISVQTDVISSILVCFVGLGITFTPTKAGAAAMIITYALELSKALMWAVRKHVDVEIGMNSVERVHEYIGIPQEPAGIIEDNRPSDNWPENGQVEVKELSLRYSPEMPDVLHLLSFSITGGQKIAVVGRTGAGKSTLSLAFFRILPFSSGSITIDGVDISEIGLYDLRSKLTIIPQDPVLFNGTVRSNLDPMSKYADAQIWEALNRVNFLDSVQSCSSDSDQSFTLDSSVLENGSNFSQGQRQLLCLARALLQSNKIIILDEATASVDHDTDQHIQNVIRQEFTDSTVICIAHRLRTVIDYDKVLVLEKGNLVEFASPSELLEQDGYFKGMCMESGEYEYLYEAANTKTN
ncbi:hypothetical protein HDV06_006903 [Boothiomyces sp. JEL0866]|nr:hypothetical protein HDV06_006903 [Boothiomyces sp. JEL0866]